MQARTISHPRYPWLALTMPLDEEPARDVESQSAAEVMRRLLAPLARWWVTFRGR